MKAWFGRMPRVSLWGFLIVTMLGAAPPGDHLRDLVRQLDARDGATRDEASRSLSTAGEAAVAPLIERMRRGNSQYIDRAASVLEQIAAGGNESTRQCVEIALEQLSQRATPELGAVVKELRIRHARLHTERVVQKIRSLGGKFAGDEKRAAEPMVFAPSRTNGPQTSSEPPLPDAAIASNASLGGAPGLIADAYVSPIFGAAGETLQAELSLTIDENWRGGDTALAALRELGGLTALALRRASLTDAALDHIAALSDLRKLDIEGCGFSSPALARFRQRRPEVRVSVSDSARLSAVHK